ncbi:hypothetical protein DFH09DRAFT_1097733, partial [Mycena vulgaris]
MALRSYDCETRAAPEGTELTQFPSAASCTRASQLDKRSPICPRHHLLVAAYRTDVPSSTFHCPFIKSRRIDMRIQWQLCQPKRKHSLGNGHAEDLFPPREAPKDLLPGTASMLAAVLSPVEASSAVCGGAAGSPRPIAMFRVPVASVEAPDQFYACMSDRSRLFNRRAIRVTIFDSMITGDVEVIKEIVRVLGFKLDDPDYSKYVQIIARGQLTIARQRFIRN